jgi:hypothetical protein
MTRRKEVRNAMKNHSELRLLLANDRIRSQAIAAANERLARPVAEPRTTFRRSVGHQIIRFGERLAEEPHLQPARSR